MRNTNKTKKHLSPFLPQSGPGGCQGSGSVHSSSSLLLFPPHTLALLECGVSPMSFCPLWTSPVWVLLMNCNSPQASGSLRFHMSCQETCSAWAPLYGLQFLPGICSSLASPQAAASSKAHPPPLGPSQAALGSLLHWGPPLIFFPFFSPPISWVAFFFALS